ncbi:hypothetical protein WT27_13750 [Burkholderia territorii]|uniref:Uncharacterized protein n=1 Tax=Burkholderia territorii TaxID=1503055 RepID=A0A105V4B8_9BURK|nr:hypothetical protein [Burkholderia territorii]KVV40977.1 hypothetical protein WT27_13750 [Burkholderia territorii]KVX33926.1 hypothetical protein WT31_09655 [Burkholderia territorii]
MTQQQAGVAASHEQKRDIAQSAFETFDFGNGVFVHGHDLWDTQQDLDYTKTVYLEYQDDKQDSPLHKATFHVRFNPQGGFLAAYAVEYVTGRLIGARAGLQLDVNALEASHESLQAAESTLRQFAFLVAISNMVQNKETLPSAKQAAADAGGDQARGLLLWVQRVIEWNDLHADSTLTQLIPIARDAISVARRKHPDESDSALRAAELEKALALGFDSVDAMRAHQAWLEKHGTKEYRAWLASIQRRVKGHSPADPERMNDDRAEWASKALEAFREVTGCQQGDDIADLLADLIHYCDRNGYAFEGELDRARQHYADETHDAKLHRGAHVQSAECARNSEQAGRATKIVVIVEGGVVHQVLTSDPAVHCLVLDRDDPTGAKLVQTGESTATLDAMALGLPQLAEDAVDRVYVSVARDLSDPRFEGDELATKILSSLRQSSPRPKMTPSQDL